MSLDDARNVAIIYAAAVSTIALAISLLNTYISWRNQNVRLKLLLGYETIKEEGDKGRTLSAIQIGVANVGMVPTTVAFRASLVNPDGKTVSKGGPTGDILVAPGGVRDFKFGVSKNPYPKRVKEIFAVDSVGKRHYLTGEHKRKLNKLLKEQRAETLKE